jgi:hypothetical protein
VAAQCALEALKMVTMCSSGLNNYMMYVGTHGVYTLTTPYERDEQCPICSPGVLLEVDPSASLQQVGWPPRTGGQLGLGKAGSRGLAAFSSVWVGGDRVVASILGLAWARV